MKSLSDIFHNTIFRIPDYQRGYAWQNEQLEDLWRDILNLFDNNRTHYMGMIGVEAVPVEKYKSWNGINLRIHSENRFKFFHIVDGQQRFLTIAILLQAIIDSFQDEKGIYFGDSKKEIIKKYLYREDIKDEKLYLIGYETDDPSYKFLIKNIFAHETKGELINTAYTKNIANAKKYFKKKINSLSKFKIDNKCLSEFSNHVKDVNMTEKIQRGIDYPNFKKEFKNEKELFDELLTKLKINENKIELYKEDLIKYFSIDKLSRIFDIVTTRLRFDFNEFKEMEISMIFETMNKRGKPLSNLEMLKNRLIYLSSILNTEESEVLRSEISKTWKTIYYYIGRNEKKSLDDDVFLRYHWIMYERFDRNETKFYENDIFRKKFIVPKIQSGVLKRRYIIEYKNSLEAAIKEWFKINFPFHEVALEIGLDDDIAYWLNKFKIIGYRQFAPIILTAMMQYSNKKILKEQLITFFKAIDSFIFLLFYVSGRRSNTGTYHFLIDANKLFKGTDGVNIDSVIEDLNEIWTYGSPEDLDRGNVKGYLDIDYFYRYVNDLFERIPPAGKIKGYFDWGGSNQTGIKYLLYEYELYLLERENLNKRIDYSKYEMEFIFPEGKKSGTKSNEIVDWGNLPERWKENFKKFDCKQKSRLCYTIGNILLVEKRKNKIERQEVKNMSFEQRKADIYHNGSISEQELCEYDDWTPQKIYERGIRILDFMEERWNFKFSWFHNEKSKFLFLDFITT